ncbi:hypothetical protein IscW_ISCW018087 [Ixodes scapularis]|uniref:Peptidase M13 C-terminal domain-containing protein n=1 Tax=Ixodes scapularis TaxID=6945 RepID=B7PEG2_IXOSC|nr:hypothetical protein IscW_ISCW018087 [Ixodes scapularis]|eukprot:XP_002433584.1 hypothetical protein IscW_ISCW018087 [Ixodes scapularis]
MSPYSLTVSVIPLLLLLVLVMPSYIIFIYKPGDEKICHYRACPEDEAESSVQTMLQQLVRTNLPSGESTAQLAAKLMYTTGVDGIFHLSLRRAREQDGVILEFDVPNLLIKPEHLLTKNLTIKAPDNRLLAGAAQEAMGYLNITSAQIDPQAIANFIVDISELSEVSWRYSMYFRNEPPRWLRCLRLVDGLMPKALAWFYHRSHVDNPLFSDAPGRYAEHGKTISSIIESIAVYIGNNRILPTRDRITAVTKANIPHAVFHGDYFDEGERNPVFLAKIGHEIGRALVKVIDPKGTCYSQDREEIGWLSETGRTNYDKVRACVRSLYNVSDQAFKVHINTTRTLPNNMADLLALMPAFRFFRLKAAEDAHPKPRFKLPSFPELSQDRIFFYSFGEASQPFHSLNTMLRNEDLFGKVFDCKPGSPMRPTKKQRCKIWPLWTGELIEPVDVYSAKAREY